MSTLYQLADAAARCARACGGFRHLRWRRRRVDGESDPERTARLFTSLRVMLRQGRAARGVVASKTQHDELVEIIERARAHAQRLRSHAKTARDLDVIDAAAAYEMRAQQIDVAVEAADRTVQRANVIREIMPQVDAETVGFDVARGGNSKSVLYVRCRCRRTHVVDIELTGRDFRCECGLGATFDERSDGLIIVRGMNEC